MERSNRISFQPEIQSIMYAMGDCRRPLPESAKIIEETVLHEMHVYIGKAQALAEERGVQWLNAEDLMFLLRKDRKLLQRLVNALKMNDIKYRMNIQSPPSAKSDQEESSAELFDEAASDCLATKPATSKRMKLCETVLEKLDPTGDLLTLLEDGNANEDAVKRERLMRAAAYAASIDSGEYMRYTEARQVSLLSKTQTFRDWLFGVDEQQQIGGRDDESSYFDGFKPTPVLLEILNFLAYETIATLMDCAFLIKRECASVGDSGARFNDAVRLRPQNFTACVASPRTPSGGDFLPTSQQGVGNSAPTPPNKSPRNSQHVAWLLAQQAANSRQHKSQRATEATVDCLGEVAVQPWEIREAVRRLKYYNTERSVFLLYGCNNFSVT